MYMIDAYIGVNYMYSLQVDKHGNAIVCKGDRPRAPYTVIARGDYLKMLTLQVVRLENKKVAFSAIQ